MPQNPGLDGVAQRVIAGPWSKAWRVGFAQQQTPGDAYA